MSAEAVGYVYRHSPFKAGTFSVHLAIADSANDQYRNEFWLGTGALAEKTRLERRQIGRCLAKLVEGGWLEVIEAAPGRAARYRFVFREDAPVIFEARYPRQVVAGPPATNPTPTRDISDTEPATFRAPIKATQLKQPNQPKDLARPDLFDTFWTAYPRKIAKGAAERAWEKRIKSGTDPETLIAGARRFSAWCVEAARVGELEAMKFVPHPATWLNGKREQDHLTRPGTTQVSQSKTQRAIESLRARKGPDRRAG